MKTLIATLALILVSQTALAGVGGASEFGMTLSLKDKAGRDIKKSYLNHSQASAFASSQEMEEAFPNASVNPIVDVVQDSAVVIVALEIDEQGHEARTLELISTPGSVKLKKGQYGHINGTFKATLNGIDPRKSRSANNYDIYLQPVTLNCTYEYGT